MKSRIGELLIKNGVITGQQLEQALGLQAESRKKLGEILIELGYLKEKDLMWMLCEQASLPFLEVRPETMNTKLMNEFPEKLLYDNVILPLYVVGDDLHVVIGDPLNQSGVEKVREISGKNVVVAGADPKKIVELLDKYYLAEMTDKIIDDERPPQ